jgi:hypothetical protein
MKKCITLLTVLLMIMAMTLGMSACSKTSEEEPETDTKQEVEQTDEVKIVKSISEVDVDCAPYIPLQIDSITLYEDGSVKIIPTDDLKKNEIKDDKTDAIYPFREFGKAKEIYLVRFGNNGYRTVIALMDDGTLSALSARELIEDRIAVVMPNVSGRDNYVSVEEVKGEDSYKVIGKTDDGEEIELDFSLNF